MKAGQPLNHAILWMVLCISISLAGCGVSDKSRTVPEASILPAEIGTGAAVNTPAEKPAEVTAPESQQNRPDNPAASETTGGAGQTAGDGAAAGAKQEAAPSAPPVQTASNKPGAAKPGAGEKPAVQTVSLMSVRIGDSKETVAKKHGKPLDEYTMDDGEEALLVYEYKGFLIGFDAKGRIEFVTVQSTEVDPGLNGLKIGSPTKDARKHLGEPDSNTSFVLTYKAAGSVLKLDVDPKAGVIHSIKLFKGY